MASSRVPRKRPTSTTNRPSTRPPTLPSTISNADEEILLDLLSEYSSKIRVAANSFFLLKHRNERLQLLTTIMLGGVVVVLFVINSSFTSDTFFSETALTAIVIFFAVSMMLFTVFQVVLPDSRRQTVVLEDIRLTSAQLERVIVYASQYEDKIETDLAKRLQLSLRIVEAEGAVRIAEFMLQNDRPSLTILVQAILSPFEAILTGIIEVMERLGKNMRLP